MNIGDYVRNKYGIAKIVGKNHKNGKDILEFDRDIAFIINVETGEEIRKVRFLPLGENINMDKIKFGNLIDLIEVGDYVNGHRVIDIAKNQIRALYYEDINQKYALIPMINKDIKSIVTKEQFEAIQYEIK